MRGRRSDSRLKVRLPARIVTRTATRQAVLCDLSCKGAQVVVQGGLALGCEVVLEWGRFDAFGEVVWSEGARCGLAFFDPLSPQILLATRDADDGARLPRERELLRQDARRWVEGVNRL